MEEVTEARHGTLQSASAADLELSPPTPAKGGCKNASATRYGRLACSYQHFLLNVVLHVVVHQRSVWELVVLVEGVTYLRPLDVLELAQVNMWDALGARLKRASLCFLHGTAGRFQLVLGWRFWR